jgi:pimeloyl-ACP methyl ester carboxylesterase
LADYVLVHGAWGGGWAYDRLAGELRDAGHRVLVAELTGLGSRQAELHPGITLTHHIDDVCRQIAARGFDRFILAGHSWGGMVITGVAARLGGRIDALVYIDAFLPRDGESLWDVTGEWEHERYIAGQKDAPGLVAPIFGNPNGRMGRHPLLTLLEPVQLTGEEAKVPRSEYIFATGYQPTPFAKFRDAVNGRRGWSVQEWGASHDVMSDQPEKLLALLLDCAA